MDVIISPREQILTRNTTDLTVDNSKDRFSNEATNLIAKGRQFERRGYYQEAIKHYKQLEKLDLGFSALTLIAECYQQAGNLELAESHYLEALLHNTKDAEVLFSVYKNLGNLHLKKACLESAHQFYVKAYAINSKSDDLLVNFATLDLQRGDEALALEKFRHALFMNDKNDKAWCGLSLIYELFGERELALGCVKRAIDINPNNLNALHIFSQLCIKNKTPEIAVPYVENWLDQNSFSLDACLYLIELYIHNYDFIKARFTVNLGFLWEPKNLNLVTWDATLKSHGI
jgi:tetratricopeptide (TPR) repeat protein